MEKNIIWEIFLFVIITFVVTIVLSILQEKMNIAFETVILAQLSPMLSFLIISLIFKDLNFSITVEVNRSVLVRTLFSLLVPFCLIYLSYFIANKNGMEITLSKDITNLIMASIIGILIGSVGEEIGWRCFLLPLLEGKYSVLISSIIVGIIWGLWHVGHYKNGLLFMLGFLIFTVSASIILTLILKGTNYNVIISSAFHTSINLAFILFYKNSLQDTRLMIINGLVWLVMASCIMLLRVSNIW